MIHILLRTYTTVKGINEILQESATYHHMNIEMASLLCVSDDVSSTDHFV